MGIPNPVCIPHIGTSLVRSAPEEGDDDADTAQRGDGVDPFGLNVSAAGTILGTVGPLERGLIKATNAGENFEGWVVGFYGEWSDTPSYQRNSLTRKLPDGRASMGENPRSNSERG